MASVLAAGVKPASQTRSSSPRPSGRAAPFGPHHDRVEGVVRLGERLCVANGEAHSTRCAAGSGSGDTQHLRGDVDADDLPVRAEIGGELQGCLAELAADVEVPLTGALAELAALPGAQPSRRLAPCSAVHRGHEHRDVRIPIDHLVPEPVPAIRGHARRLRAIHGAVNTC